MADSLCPEAEKRAAMTDDEFWAHVFRDAGPDLEDNVDDEGDDMLDDDGSYTSACSLCGAVGACGYDLEGLPLIHAKGGQ